jgi:hypothetical protein
MSLRDFTRAYVEAALWSSTDDEGNPLDRRRAPIGEETQRQMELDAASFYERAEGAWQGITDARAGFLFWLNRNGHGSGFWDEDGLPAAAQRSLSDYAESYGSFDLYIGDGQIHGSPLSNEATSTVMAGLRGRGRGDKLREEDRPSVLGYDLNRETLTPIRQTIDTRAAGDYGADPVGDGTFRMVPSGDVVDFAERTRRLQRPMRGLGGPRGSQITGTNLFALRALVEQYGPNSLPNRVEQVHAPHLQRCYKAGLIAPNGDGRTLHLTEAGRHALETNGRPTF